MNTNKLKGVIPDKVFLELPDVITKFEINSDLRLAHFLSQCGHESGEFKALNENLNYSEKGLLSVFKKYFTTITAKLYQRKPEKIANTVYANRMGNGDAASGDGYRFRGRGYIQLTGKANYEAFSKSIGEDCVANPDLVATKYPLASAAWFFSKNGLNKKADFGTTDQIVVMITKAINGGLNGLDDRIANFKKYYNILHNDK
jgi:putative chitinase